MSYSPMYDPQSSYAERRDFYRMAADCEVLIQLPGGAEAKGKVRNLSGSGIAFCCDSDLVEGQFVELTVQMLDERAEPLRANGEVIRARRDDKEVEMPFEVVCSMAVTYQ